MRILKKILKVLGLVVVALVALVAFLLWWTHPKRPVTGVFVREAGAGVFKFTDIPRGRVLSAQEVDGKITSANAPDSLMNTSCVTRNSNCSM